MNAEPNAHVTQHQVPAIGQVVDTIHGRQQVMDVLDGFPHEAPTVYFRPEHGGREWCVAVARLGEVLRTAGTP